MAIPYAPLVRLLAGLNAVFDLHTGGPRRPVFFDIDRTSPALADLTRHHPAIRQELDGLLAGKAAIPRYHDLDELQRGISGTVDPERSWKVIYLHAMGEKPAGNRAHCPRTCELLDRVPNLFQAFFSILEGGKSIPAHCGPYRGYLRYHLGLLVPERDPPTLRVRDHLYTWREGEAVLFDDSWEHEVRNRAASDRVVLIVDIRRPMPLPLDLLNRTVEAVMRVTYGR